MRDKVQVALGGLTMAIAAILIAAYAVQASEEESGAETHGPMQGTPAEGASDEFPEVDWDYWLGVNPDVVGWVTVPGTAIDQPIVHAREWEDGYYLSHGVDRRPEAMGCAFLDSGCVEKLDSQNCVVYGHNWSGGRMFSDFARFSDEAFAAAHPVILLQTPQSKTRLQVRCVEVADGTDATNATRFDDAEAFKSWFQTRYAASAVKLGPAPVGPDMPDRVHTFCTCSDDKARDERVLVYATT